MASDTSNLNFDLIKSAYNDLASNVPGENEISLFTSLYKKLQEVSVAHDNYLQQELSEIDSGYKNSLSATCNKINENYKGLVSTLATAEKYSGINSGGSVDTGGISGGSGVTGGGYVGGDYTANSYTPASTSESSSYTGSSTTPYARLSSSTVPTQTSDISETSYRGTTASSSTPRVSGGSIHTGASIGAGGAALAGAVGGLGGVNVRGDSVLTQTSYPLGNYSVNGAFISDLEKEKLKEKLVNIGFSDEEIDAVMTGEYNVSKILVDKISEKLVEAYKTDSGIREYLKEQYGFDIFNDDGTVNNDRLSLALYMDDKNGLDNYSIINTLSKKYGISIVDQATMKSYIGQFESMFMKDSKIRDKFKEEYGFDVFNDDGTINKDRLTLAMLIDEKSNGKYSIEKFIKDAESRALVNTLGNDVTKITGEQKESGSKLPYIAGAAAVGGAVVAGGIAINKKKQQEEEHESKNRFILNNLDYQDEDDWVHNIISNSELDNEEM